MSVKLGILGVCGHIFGKFDKKLINRVELEIEECKLSNYLIREKCLNQNWNFASVVLVAY